ncbi:MAG: hypothetical protein CMF38_01500 [Legionellaceae bacterium]|nr:hypothetical protein [Legionellaceae bacterium]HAF88096.1 hypothetical protein [Legionellales bacterium]HCA89857.1 hypothetical protein [Legionellales bacterium]|tara:strand:+ start:1404 stop:2120 length:717 start_codon:yes stop_codon:yes gene_type:complete
MMWQTFNGRCIYQSSNLSVYENAFFRWLYLESNAYQTMLYKRNPAKYGLYYVKTLGFFARSLPGRSCLLGLGGGGVAHYLAPSADHPLTIIEQHPEVIDIAWRFFMLDKLSSTHIICADAGAFMAQTHTFEHILIDLFDSHDMPSCCYDIAFYQQCFANLSATGLLAINLADARKYLHILHLLTSVHAQVLTLNIKRCNNLILVASCHKTYFLTKLLKQPELNSLKWDSRFGYLAELK